jgi:hypothetical protein
MIKKRKTKKVPWAGWKSHLKKTRKKMYKQCGQTCFLWDHLKFPICKKDTCDIDKRGLWAAYIRAKQLEKKIPKYKKVSRKAKKLLKKYN